VRRAKLYYLRDLRGKKARIKERRIDDTKLAAMEAAAAARAAEVAEASEEDEEVSVPDTDGTGSAQTLALEGDVATEAEAQTEDEASSQPAAEPADEPASEDAEEQPEA
jgi:hypothetical protein